MQLRNAVIVLSGGGGAGVPPFEIDEGDFEPDGITYENTDLAGVAFLVQLRNTSTWLIEGIDFDYLPAGGLELLPAPGQPESMTDTDFVLVIFA